MFRFIFRRCWAVEQVKTASKWKYSNQRQQQQQQHFHINNSVALFNSYNTLEVETTKSTDFSAWALNTTRKPCCRKETARCRKCSFRLKFANNIPYKYKTSRASKATLQSSNQWQTCWRKTQFNTKSGFKVIQSHVFGVSGKAVRQ